MLPSRQLEASDQILHARDLVPLEVGSSPSMSLLQMNGSTKFAVPTWTADAPAMMNSSASSTVAMPPMPMIGSFTAWWHS